MDAALAQSPWLAGKGYSLADIGFAVYINRADELQLGEALLARRPNVTRWLSALRARPNYVAAVTAYHHAPVTNIMAEQGARLRPRIAEIVRAMPR